MSKNPPHSFGNPAFDFGDAKSFNYLSHCHPSVEATQINSLNLSPDKNSKERLIYRVLFCKPRHTRGYITQSYIYFTALLDENEYEIYK